MPRSRTWSSESSESDGDEEDGVSRPLRFLLEKETRGDVQKEGIGIGIGTGIGRVVGRGGRGGALSELAG